MPQITVKSTSVKKGENEKGPWVNTMITPTEGGKWTTFSESAQYLKGGDVINITEYEEGQGNKANKITKWEKVEQAQQPSTRGNGNYPDMSKEEWAEKQRIERESIEAQVAVKAICQLVSNWPEHETLTDDVARVLAKAIEWSEQKIDRALSVKPAPAASSAAKSPPVPSGKLDTGQVDMSPIQHRGDLWMRCKNIGVGQIEGLNILGIENQEDIIDLDEAFSAIVKHVAGRSAS